MKNLLSGIGSKKIMGAALVMVTLGVGLGVVNNFSGNDQKRANDAALSNLSENSYNTFPGGAVSRSELERQLGAEQDNNTARFFRMAPDGSTIDEDDEYNPDMDSEGFVYGSGSNGQGGAGQGSVRQGAEGYSNNYQGYQGDMYGAGIPAGAEGGAEYSQGGQDMQGTVGGGQGKAAPQGNFRGPGSIKNSKESNASGNYTVKGKKSVNTFAKPSNPSASEGGAGGTSVAGGAAGSDSKNNMAKPKEAAAKAEKAKKDRAERNRIRRETQLNKLASAGGGSGSSGSISGGSSGGSSLGGSGSGGSSSGAVRNSNSAPAAVDNSSSGFKAGRNSAMGGFNVARAGYAGSGEGASPKGGGGDRSSINQLLYSHSASKNAARLTSEGSKEAARDAFEQNGENDTGVLIADGASIRNAISQLPDSGSAGKAPSLSLANTEAKIQQQEDALDELQKKINNKYLWLILGTLVIGIVLGYVVKLAYDAPAAWWWWVIAGVLTLGAFAFIHAMVHGFGNGMFGEPGEDSILGMINQMDDKDKFGMINESLDTDGKRRSAWWTYGGLLLGIGLCWLPWENICSWFKNLFGGGGSGGGAGQISAEVSQEIAQKMGGFHTGGPYI